MEYFINNPIHLYLAIAISIVNGILMCLAGGKLFQIIQLSGYKLSGYRAWLKDTKVKYLSRLVMLTFLGLAGVVVTNALFDGFGDYYSYIGLFFYGYFTIIFILNIIHLPQKTPLVQTKRMNRLIVTVFLLMSILSFVLITLFSLYVPYVKFGIVALTPIFLPVIVPLAHLIMIPLESIIRLSYINKAKKKLKKYDKLIKIGITGSYGKTTTKHFLNVMLSKKYSVCMTPHSFNTPMGLTKVVLKYLKPENDVLIAEMGARQMGDIKYLCNFIKPKHGIITSVGCQHLATFGSIENIIKTKGELINGTSEDGIMIFNAENENSKNMFDTCVKEKYLTGIDKENAYLNIKNIEVSQSGSKFTLIVDGKETECETSLLGRHNIEDIALAAALAYKLGVKLVQIKNAIRELKPVSHRMEILDRDGMIVIDNSYNASVESSISSMEVLKSFKESTKIVITPGLVELGVVEGPENVKFGSRLAEVATYVIIVNKVNANSIKSGLISANFDKEKIFEIEKLSQAANILEKLVVKDDTVVLYENDLPDNYT